MKPSNPPAFPCKFMKHKSGEIGNQVPIFEDGEGMTLRDYFAANAMQGLLAYDSDYTLNDLARASYKYADAMLKAREAFND